MATLGVRWLAAQGIKPHHQAGTIGNALRRLPRTDRDLAVRLMETPAWKEARRSAPRVVGRAS